MSPIFSHIDQIIALCKQNSVKELYAYGSVLTDHFKEESDIDLLIDFQQVSPIEYSKNYFNFKFALEQLLEYRIDLLEVRGLRNPFITQEINKRKQILYAA